MTFALHVPTHTKFHRLFYYPVLPILLQHFTVGTHLITFNGSIIGKTYHQLLSFPGHLFTIGARTDPYRIHH